MGITNRPSQASSTNKEKQTLDAIHKHLLTELAKITPKEDALPEVKTQHQQFVQIINSLKG